MVDEPDALVLKLLKLLLVSTRLRLKSEVRDVYELVRVGSGDENWELGPSNWRGFLSVWESCSSSSILALYCSQSAPR
jgi:hypothetical protein